MTNDNLYELVARQARRRPDAVAIIDRGPVTYGDLMARTDRIARALAGRGLRAEAPVGVLMRRDADLPATLLAVLKVGACYVPLDLDDPPARLAGMIRGASCELVVGTGTLLTALCADDAKRADETLGAELLDVADLLEAGCPVDGADPLDDGCDDLGVAPGGDRLAYVLFTSGSTGAPKGVEVEHRSVVNLLHAARHLLAFDESDRYLAVSTIGFDISVAELFVPLITGGSLLLRDRRLLLDPVALATEIRDHRVTVVQTGPTVWSTVLAAVPDFPRLRVAISTGEAIAPAVADRLIGTADHVWNLYGPTEATVWATGHRLGPPSGTLSVLESPSAAPGAVASSVSAPIGVALDNVKAVVVGHDGEDVPDGTEGELWLGGAALARGYRGNELLTNDRFVVRGEHRFYRTGDTVSRDAQGVLHYFGRSDDQIKVRGVRIEPMEVESAILAVPGVMAAAATWFESATGARSILAAVVPQPGVQLLPRQLHDALADMLPGPMIPSRFVFCDTLPRSSSGKVDRTAIRDLGHEDAGGRVGVQPPLTATERRLIGVWELTLGVDAVARDDHFFTIGGDSLVAVTMMLEVEEVFAVSLPIRVLFESPTLQGLAARIDEAMVRPDAWSNAEYVFPLVEGEGTPFFFCGIDLKMARRGLWGVDCPLYAVSQWAQGKGFLQARSVEDLARKQLEAITSIQPCGPYRIGGFSFGGLIAFELAHLLRDRGDEVELLFLLDATEPYRTVAAPRDKSVRQSLLSRTSAHLASLDGVHGLVRGARNIAKRVMVNVVNLGGRVPTWQWLNYKIVHLYGRHPSHISTRLVPKDRWPAYWYTSLRLAKSYVARPYDGPAAAVFLDEGERSASWRALLEPGTATFIVETPTHGELFAEPAVSRWLEFLRPLVSTPAEMR
ncbi:MAG: amino acid adenylation domain-containing protein [Actinomycetota bacterium]|mgnify:CR=1 FL=1